MNNVIIKAYKAKSKNLSSILRLFVCCLFAMFCVQQIWGTVHTYDFTSVNNFYTTSGGSTHPSTGSDNKYAANGTFYGSDGACFTVLYANKVYFSTSYLMVGNQSPVLQLPTYANEKITQVKFWNTSGCSTSVKVTIKSGSNTASSEQTWSTQSSSYTYSIGSDYQETTLKLNVVSANAQITKIEITTESTSSKTDISVSAVTPAKEVTVCGNTLDLSTAFTVSPASTGTRTYEIVSGGTGTGSITGSTFTGTGAGTVNVKLTVDATNDYNSGNGTATVTVNAASARAVKWYVEGEALATGHGGSESVAPGNQATPPDNPSSSCGGTFYGWVASGDDVIGNKPSDANITAPSTVYTTSNKPTITCDGPVDFYAVFKKQ